MKSPSLVIVLAEDDYHQRLVRRFLHKCGFGNYQIRFSPVSKGKGCGEQWVRKAYSEEVKACRRRNAKASTALIVVVDADNNPINARREQLRKALEDQKIPARTDEDRITHLVPKWSVETWILCLTGGTVTESESYRLHPDIENRLSAAAEALWHWSRPNFILPVHCVPSLSDGITELRRFTPPH